MGGLARTLLKTCGLLPAAAALVIASVPAAKAKPASCFMACIEERQPKTDDYFAFSQDVNACRDMCDGEALASLKSSGLYEAYKGCKPEPLSKAEFRDLRANNPSWQAAFSVFSWEIRNPLPDRVLTGIEIKTQDMNLIDVTMSSSGIIPPGETGVFVITEFFDGYPAVRYSTKVIGATACKVK